MFQKVNFLIFFFSDIKAQENEFANVKKVLFLMV
jgi:hypothetical protein